MSLHERWAQAVMEGLARVPRRALLVSTGLDDPPPRKSSIGVITMTGDVAACLKSSCPHRNRPPLAGRGEVSISYSTLFSSDEASLGDAGIRITPASHQHIAVAVELLSRRHAFEGIIAVAGSDETLPGVMMAIARLNLPSVLVYGGVIRPGRVPSCKASVGEAPEVRSDAPLTNASDALELPCSPTGSVCPRQFTASTMAMVAEALGLTPLGSDTSEYSERLKLGRRAGEIVMRLLDEGGPRPRSLITRKSLENACAAVAVTSGSTNAALHLPAIAHEAGVKFNVDDVAAVFRRTLVGADLEPGGRRLVSDLYQVGGVPAVLTKLLASGALNRDALTIEGTELHAALSWVPAATLESPQAGAP